jgi:hypothetical protein
MKTIVSIVIVIFLLKTHLLFSQAIIIDHNCAKLEPIPESAIQQAKSNLHIAYWHTSHGSQLTEGMKSLRDLTLTNLVGYKGDIYDWNNGGAGGAMDLEDKYEGDLGHNGDLAWERTTRAFLADADNSDVNVIMWSWCGGASDNTEAGINAYLNAMDQLEIDFPNVKFVYMTGHLDGSGEAGNLNVMNQLIRDYCTQNNKVLYDFADIESYDPDGNYFLDKRANDNCDYDSNGNGTRDANWATEWQTAHTENIDWYTCSAAHSQPLNGNLKAYAAWWLWAKLAGWGAVSLTATPDQQLNETNFDDRSISLEIAGDQFADAALETSNFQLNNAPAGTSIESINYTDATHAELNIAFDGTDFDTDISNFSVSVLAAELVGTVNLTSNELTISAYNERISISSTVALSESNLDAAVIDILLEDESFADATLETSNFQLNNAPTGTSVGSINYTDATHAELNIAFDGTDFDTDISNFSISVLAVELNGSSDLTSNELVITAELESGINGLDNNLKNSLFPNPNNGAFTMKYFSDRADVFDFKIINSLGKIILNKKIQVIKGENQIEFNIHSLVSGSYFIVIDTKKGAKNYPFSVN